MVEAGLSDKAGLIGKAGLVVEAGLSGKAGLIGKAGLVVEAGLSGKAGLIGKAGSSSESESEGTQMICRVLYCNMGRREAVSRGGPRRRKVASTSALRKT